MEKYSLRVMTKDDLHYLEDLQRIEFRTQKNPWGAKSIEECFSDSFKLIGVFAEKKLIGFSCIYNTKFTTDLLTIGIDPDYQGKKLGAMLLKRTLEEADLIGAEECFLEVRVSNTVAKNLYKKFGFKEVGIRKNYYEAMGNYASEDAITMQLENIKGTLSNLIE